MKLSALLLCLPVTVLAVEFGSPGFPSSRMDADGRLVEDWGAVGVRLAGDGPFRVAAVKLDQLIPAARAVAQRGPVMMTLTAYRAPIWPSGVDVLTVRVEETQGQPAAVAVGLDLPAKTRIGNRTVTLNKRTVLTFPAPQPDDASWRAWGSCDDATSLPRWGKPSVPCDPAFRNIRAGMGGGPIRYQFSVPNKSAAKVVLGFCESHWAKAGARPLLCRVEGAPPQTVDPVAKWGQHKPGVLTFDARDENADGKLDISVRAAPGAADRNPILNAIWIFPATTTLKLEDVIAGKLNSAATRYVDVGGPNDQSLFPTDKVEYKIRLPARGVRELTFYVACTGNNAPSPTTSAWTPETLYRAALDVWRGQLTKR
jgi:hypothetical protein